MCQRLRDLQQSITAYATGFDANTLTPGQAGEVVRVCAQIEASAASIKYDHRADYATTKITAFDLLDKVCTHHHRLKTNQGWALVEGRHKRAFVPPHDPRHPHFAPSPANSGPSPPSADP